MDKKLNTNYTFEFYDGTKIELTLTFYSLYQLKEKNKAMYERYHRIMGDNSKGKYDELEMISVLYTAYICAHINDEEIMTEEEFMIMCGCDRIAVAAAVKALTQPKKQKASGSHL